MNLDAPLRIASELLEIPARQLVAPGARGEYRRLDARVRLARCVFLEWLAVGRRNGQPLTSAKVAGLTGLPLATVKNRRRVVRERRSQDHRIGAMLTILQIRGDL